MTKFDSIVFSSCLSCGCHVPRGQSYCGAHRPIRRGSGAARERFRREVMRRAGGRCQCIENGKRCPVTDPAQLEAHHVRALFDGGENAASNGLLVCKAHHAILTAAQGRAA